jgi:hypothetical protein
MLTPDGKSVWPFPGPIARRGGMFFEVLEKERGRPAVAGRREEVKKGARGMPRLWLAKKGATSSDIPRGAAHGLRSAGSRMGQPGILKRCHPQGGRPGELKHLSSRRKRKQ